MKAIIVSKTGGVEVLEYKEIQKPTIKSDEVLIKVKTTSVNFADIKARLGQYHGLANTKFIPGFDCSGFIEAIGDEVKSFKKGQRVVAFTSGGSYVEYAKAQTNLVYAIPENVSFDDAAAALSVGVTSYDLILKAARLLVGETILIHAAAGGVGTTAVQIAKMNGASKIIGTVGSDEKVDIVKDAGADVVINYRKSNFVEHVLNATKNHGVDVILDSIAGSNFEQSIECLARFGRIVTFGHANDGSVPGNIKTNDLHSSCRSVIGYSSGTYCKFRPNELKEGATNIMKYLEDRSLKMFISRSFPLVDVRIAHTFVESRKSTGKVLLRP